jgi:hypothetical protein
VRALLGSSLAPSAALIAAILLAIAPARADRISDAEDLFRRAKALMAQNKHDEACPLLGESYRLDPGMGTLLNLALCHEHVGKTASAWGEFRSVEQQARASVPPNESRAQLAREHADKLQPRLSRVRIVVPAESRAPGLVVKVDGEAKGEPLWAGIPVDPGTRSVEATAPQKRALVIKVKIDDEGVLQTVTIPVLANAPVTAVPAGAGGAQQLEELEQYAATRARRTAGYVIGGIGLVTLAVGASFGVAAIVNDNDAKRCSPCIVNTDPASTSDRATDRAFVFANIANVTVPLGVVGALVGGYLVLSAGPSQKVALTPVTSPTSAGLAVSGLW